MKRVGVCYRAGVCLLVELPDDLLVTVYVQLGDSIRSKASLGQTCRLLHMLGGNAHVGRTLLRSSSLFGSRLVAPHYSSDCRRFQNVLQDPRLVYLRRLTLVVNTPSFASGSGRGCALLQRKVPALRYFTLNNLLSRQLQSRLPLSAPALTHLVRSMPNLLSLTITDVPNLGRGFFASLRLIRGLRSLNIHRCSMTHTFAIEFGDDEEFITGRFLPADLSLLQLDVTNIGCAINVAKNRLTPLWFLSNTTNLAVLGLEAGANILSVDVGYAIACIGKLARGLHRFQSGSCILLALFDFCRDLMGPACMKYSVLRV